MIRYSVDIHNNLKQISIHEYEPVGSVCVGCVGRCRDEEQYVPQSTNVTSVVTQLVLYTRYWYRNSCAVSDMKARVAQFQTKRCHNEFVSHNLHSDDVFTHICILCSCIWRSLNLESKVKGKAIPVTGCEGP
jgi:hypothetical protein